MTPRRQKADSTSVSLHFDKLALITLFFVPLTAKEELIGLVKEYKGRKYDEEITAIDTLGGK